MSISKPPVLNYSLHVLEKNSINFFMQAELAIPDKRGDRCTVAELNSILATVLVPKRDGGHLRT